VSNAAPKAKHPKPEWLKVRAPGGENYLKIKADLAKFNLHTVCEEARCPNIGECWSGGTATFMLLGDTCTRGCKFCSVKTGNPKGEVDAFEPEKIAHTVSSMNLSYIVLTSVDRDDLPDQGVSHFVRTVELTKTMRPEMLMEVLTPDWRGDDVCIETMARSGADVLAHNVETIERLQREVRDPRCSYSQSMHVLQNYLKKGTESGRKVVTKTSIMMGLGESDEEVLKCMQDLVSIGVRVLTLGQYLQPTHRKLDVKEYVSPERFSALAKEGEAMGFAYVAAGPLVRSSYRAGEYFIEKILRGEKSDGSILAPKRNEQQSVTI
jgi:lipoic acid synthetase